MEKKYIKEITRLDYYLIDVMAWYEGESSELKKWLEFGFYNSFFVVENNNLEVYYDLEECEEFDKVLEEKLTEDFFNRLCDYFFELIEQSKNAETKDEIFKIIVKCWPALVIFEEISNYPEYASDSMLRRIIRLRKTTESFSYNLSKKVNSISDLDTYIFFKGKIIKEPFEEFIKTNNFIIVKEI
ncbi:MAG: hypothetical protein AABW81_00175 [Nanoarchaeota archaeon]